MRTFLFLINVVLVSLKISTSDLYSKISAQDDRVFNLVNEPVKYGARRLVKSIKKLNSYLELVIKSMYKNKEETENVILSLVRQGGLKYVDTMIKDEELKADFNWTDELLITLYEERKKTLSLLHFIKMAYNDFFSYLVYN